MARFLFLKESKTYFNLDHVTAVKLQEQAGKEVAEVLFTGSTDLNWLPGRMWASSLRRCTKTSAIRRSCCDFLVPSRFSRGQVSG